MGACGSRFQVMQIFYIESHISMKNGGDKKQKEGNAHIESFHAPMMLYSLTEPDIWYRIFIL